MPKAAAAEAEPEPDLSKIVVADAGDELVALASLDGLFSLMIEDDGEAAAAAAWAVGDEVEVVVVASLPTEQSPPLTPLELFPEAVPDAKEPSAEPVVVALLLPFFFPDEDAETDDPFAVDVVLDAPFPLTPGSDMISVN